MRDGYKFAQGEVKTAASLVAEDAGGRPARLLPAGAPSGRSTKRQVVPKSLHQRAYLDAIEQHDVVFGVGPAGTGKTYLAMAQAVVVPARRSASAGSS